MIARTTTTTARRRVALIGSAALLLGAAATVTAAAATSGNSGKPEKLAPRGQDYLDGQVGNQCSVPPAQRSSGWVCP